MKRLITFVVLIVFIPIMLIGQTADPGRTPRWDRLRDYLNNGIRNMTLYGTLTVGEDDSSYDVKLFGATSGNYFLWDESADLVSIVNTSATTTGTDRAFNLNMTQTGASATKILEALRVNIDANVQTGDWVNAIVARVDYGASGSASGGMVAPLCAELSLPENTPSGGAYYIADFEMDAPANHLEHGNVSYPTAWINFAIYGDATAIASVEDYAFLFRTDGFTSASGNMIYNNTIRTRIGSSTMYLPLSDAEGEYSSAYLIDISNTTDATSTTTGSIATDGGVGIAKKLFVGLEATFLNNAAAATFGNVLTDADVVLAFDAVTAQGSLTYMEDEDRFDFDNDVDVIGDLTAATVASDGAVSGTTITGTGKISTLLTTEQFRLSYDATNYATWTVAADGALTIATVDASAAEGDINFNPDGYVGIKTAVPATELDVTGAGTFSGILSVDDVTDATGTTDGSFHTDGGAGIAKKLYVGTDLAVDGVSNLDNIDVDGTLDVAGGSNVFASDGDTLKLQLYQHLMAIALEVGDTRIFGIDTLGNASSVGSFDQTITNTIAGGETGHYAYVSHTTNALTGEAIGIHGNARVNTIDSPAGSVIGGKFQAGNMDVGTDLSGARGIYIDVVNKIPVGATTWDVARGVEVSMDLDQGSAGNVNTITDAYMFYGVYNAPTTGTYSTITNGYGIFVRNEAVGGTGQTLDAAFYADDRNMGVAGWNYGLDFNGIGANGFGVADIRFQDGTVFISGYNGSPNGAVTAGKGSLCVDTTNAKLYINTNGGTTWAEITQ